MKRLLSWAIIGIFCMGIVPILSAQQPIKTTKDRPVKVIQQPPANIQKPVKIVAPTHVPKEEGTTQPVQQPKQVQPPVMDMAIDMEQLNQPLLVSQKYESLLQDNTTFIDERGKYGMTFDIIKKQDGGFALAYGSATENLDIYTKVILFHLRPDLAQRGNSIILSMPDEELQQLVLNEFSAGNLSVVYTANSAKCINSAGNRDNALAVLRSVEVKSNGSLKSRLVDDEYARIQLKGVVKGGSNDISVVYNHNGKGKVALAGLYLGSHTMECDLNPLPTQEFNFSINEAPSHQPVVKSVSQAQNMILIHTSTRMQTPVWNLGDQGLNSGRSLKPVWPLLSVDVYEVANRGGIRPCLYDNDPYTVYTDAMDLSKVSEMFALSDGNLGAIETTGNQTSFNIFDSHLKRVHPKVILNGNIHRIRSKWKNSATTVSCSSIRPNRVRISNSAPWFTIGVRTKFCGAARRYYGKNWPQNGKRSINWSEQTITD